jgi:hypothetical protein
MRWIALLGLILAGNAQAAPPAAEIAQSAARYVGPKIEQVFRFRPRVRRPANFQPIQPGANVVIDGGAVTTLDEAVRPIRDKVGHQCASRSGEGRTHCEEMLKQ